MTKSRLLAVPIGIMVTAMGSNLLAAETETTRFTTAPPSGFEQLEAERELVLDVYYGGEKRGTARVAAFADRVEFMDPRLVASFVNDALPTSDLISQLSRPMRANRDRSCGLSGFEGCGTLDTSSVGVILDEDRFRIDLFVAPGLRLSAGVRSDNFLDRPRDAFSLVSLTGVTISGSSEFNGTSFRLQNRSIAAIGAARLRSDISLQDGRALTFDNLVMEADRRDWRFSAGQFWVPGTDLISRRKTIGVGLSSQLDTRRDKDQLLGTPIEVFLNAPARVEVFVDGQLISSQILSAGNRALETSRWPTGSYDVVLRVHEPGQAPREERRFFSRDEAIAPLGHPIYQVYAGVYSNGAAFRSPTPFAQGSVGYRLSDRAAVRASAIVTKSKIIADIGSTFTTKSVNLAASGLLSSSGDRGVALRGYSTGLRGVAASFDLRKMWSPKAPLLPYSTRTNTFDAVAVTPYDQGSFTQVSAQTSARLGKATVRFSGYFRDTPKGRATYSVGPSVDVPIVRSSQFSLVGEADARKTDTGFSSYAGIRLLLSEGPRSVSARAGMHDGSGMKPQLRGEVQGAVFGENDNSQWSANAAIGRSETTYARVAGDIRSVRLNARGEALHEFGSGTQYSMSAETGLVIGAGRAEIGGGIVRDGAMIVTTEGSNTKKLDVFVNKVKAGTSQDGRPLVVYLEPYREYQVEAKPHDAALVTGDFTDRRVTVYPGTVSRVSWKASQFFIGFGRLVSADGQPIGGAEISGPHGVAETDEDGYFQIDLGASEKLEVKGVAIACQFSAPSDVPQSGYVKLGDVVCR